MISQTITGKRPVEVAHEGSDNANFLANPSDAAGLNMSGHSTGGSRYTALMRFDDLFIPRGATVTNAVLRVTPINASNDDADLNMHCEDIGECPTLATLASIFTERTARLTTAGPAWASASLGAAEVSSDTFHTALQELVRRGDYEQGSVGVLFDGSSSIGVLKVVTSEIYLDYTYELYAAQFGLTVTNDAEGDAYALDHRVSEVTIRCDTGSAAPVQFKVPGVLDDWYNLPAGTSLSVFYPPKDVGSRVLDHIIARVASGTGTFSYAVSGA